MFLTDAEDDCTISKNPSTPAVSGARTEEPQARFCHVLTAGSEPRSCGPLHGDVGRPLRSSPPQMDFFQNGYDGPHGARQTIFASLSKRTTEAAEVFCRIPARDTIPLTPIAAAYPAVSSR